MGQPSFGGKVEWCGADPYLKSFGLISMSFITYLKRLLVEQKAVYDLSRNQEFNSFYFIGFRKSAAAINFITCVEADRLTECQIVELRDQFFNAVQAVSYGFGLKPLARNDD
ncbi:MAG: hypothetical protein WA885_19230 [Phormidesmis sp.]